MTPLFLMSLQ